ncbi:F-box/LRR-repeat protein 3-like [Thrips palmi]|uniref:F-box/LRR-repeat protein 3-like n=1 Tax=Thrips palmi TaxID=161013 RepID=A0A6P8Y6B4_THRPL|nr:F-box/LRR-repeat protein 3-like [Thrips palmi]XP_034235159.1 F-box/LRR-repeat protein 3-like [Thrips palmi]
MKPSCCYMTGSLNSIGRLARRSGSKRRRLDAEVPAAVPAAEFKDDDDEEDDDEEWLDAGVLDRHQAQAAVGPFGTLHDADLADDDSPVEAEGPVPEAGRGLDGVDTGWWPRALVWGRPSDVRRAPPSRHHRLGALGLQGASSSASRTARLGHDHGRLNQGRDVGDAFSPKDTLGRQNTADPGVANQREQDWSQLPTDLLITIFQLLALQDLGRCAQVCRGWRRASQEPCLWRTAEFVLGSTLRPEPTPPALVNFILEEHAQHLKFVVLRTDSSAESARGACRILARLVKCSLKTLALMSGAARPSLLDVDGAEEKQFASALTLVLDHSSPSLRALAVDHTLVDDPSLQALAGVGSSSAGSLQLLRCKSCPRLSPGGVLALVDHCRCLRELSISYTLLSDDLLNALSSERHVCLEVLRVDVYTDADTALRPIASSSWRALVAHSPQLNLVMYLFAIQDESFDNLFTSYIPVTHLYFGDYVPTSVLSRVGAFCPRLVELVVGANGNSVIDKQLLDVATNCQQLSSLGLAECQVTCSALVRLAEACGPRLSQLVVMEECLVEDGVHDLASTCASVSRVLGRDWSPEFMPMW